MLIEIDKGIAVNPQFITVVGRKAQIGNALDHIEKTVIQTVAGPLETTIPYDTVIEKLKGKEWM